MRVVDKVRHRRQHGGESPASCGTGGEHGVESPASCGTGGEHAIAVRCRIIGVATASSTSRGGCNVRQEDVVMGAATASTTTRWRWWW